MTAGELLIRVFSELYDMPEDIAGQMLNRVVYNKPKGIKEGFDRELDDEEVNRLLEGILADKEGFKKSMEEDPGGIDKWLRRN